MVNFLIVSFAIFMIVKQLARLQKKQAEEAAAAAPPAPPRSEVLLEEIRNLLKERRYSPLFFASDSGAMVPPSSSGHGLILPPIEAGST